MQAGLDSLGAVELRNAVSAKFGVALPATVAFDFPTTKALALFVAQSLRPFEPSISQVGLSSKDHFATGACKSAD